MKIYSSVRLGVSPEINALSTLLIVAVSSAVIIVSLMGKHMERKRAREEAAAVAG